jgi:hypothetical protein
METKPMSKMQLICGSGLEAFDWWVMMEVVVAAADPRILHTWKYIRKKSSSWMGWGLRHER